MTFEPTHITTNAIGSIPTGTPIRVANIRSFANFADLLGYLGDQPYISYKHVGFGSGSAIFTDERASNFRTFATEPGDYVITDGDRFSVSTNDTGWKPIPDESPETETKVTLRFRMSNGDEYSTRPMTAEDAEPLFEGAQDLGHLRHLWFDLTDNSKVVLNPAHVSSVEVIHNV